MQVGGEWIRRNDGGGGGNALFIHGAAHGHTLPFALIDLRCTTAYEQHVPGLAATSCPAGSTGGLMPALATG